MQETRPTLSRRETAGLVCLSFVAWFAWLWGEPAQSWAAYPVALAGYSVVWYRLHQRCRHRGLILAMIAPFVVTALLLPPRLSDDYHRYLWEGHVQNQGYSPYAHSPQSLFDTLNHPSEPHINHAHLPAIYPPLSQFAFRVADALGHDVFPWKCLLLLALLGCRCFLSSRDTLLLVGNPLVLVEALWNAHIDALGIPAVYALLILMRRGRLGAGATAGVALFGIKLVPVVLSLFPLRGLTWRQKSGFAFLGLTGSILLYLPFLADGAALLRSPGAFSLHWYFNNPFFAVLHQQLPAEAVRPLLGTIMLLCWGWLWFRPWSIRDRTRWAWIVLLCLSPTVYPWYLLWLAPLTPTRAWPRLLAAYCFCCLSYSVLPNWQQSGVWDLHAGLLVLEWVGLFFCFIQLRPRAKANPGGPPA